MRGGCCTERGCRAVLQVGNGVRPRPEHVTRYHGDRRGSTRGSRAAGLWARARQEAAGPTEGAGTLPFPCEALGSVAAPCSYLRCERASDGKDVARCAGQEPPAPAPKKPAESLLQPRNENKSPLKRISSSRAG